MVWSGLGCGGAWFWPRRYHTQWFCAYRVPSVLCSLFNSCLRGRCVFSGQDIQIFAGWSLGQTRAWKHYCIGGALGRLMPCGRRMGQFSFPWRILSGNACEQPGVDVRCRVLCAFQSPWPRATQAEGRHRGRFVTSETSNAQLRTFNVEPGEGCAVPILWFGVGS
jgi:hypothetical protein